MVRRCEHHHAQAGRFGVSFKHDAARERLRIHTLLPNTLPDDRTLVGVGDIILSINGEAVDELEPAQVTALIAFLQLLPQDPFDNFLPQACSTTR